jgi:DNA-directed RNA polymerase II subunit RPB1
MKTPSLKIYLSRELDERALLDVITNRLPEQEIGQYIISSKVYFDWNPKDSEVREIIMDDVREYKGLTPWVLVIVFDKTRKILYDLWLEITESIAREYGSLCDVNHTIFSEERLAVELRCKEGALDRQNEQKTYYDLLIHINECISSLKLGKGIKGIKKVFKRKEVLLVEQPSGELKKDSKLILETKGSNLREVLSLPFVDPYNTTTNDVMETADVLGVEAARQVFINEFRMVLSCYNIYINARHTSTLADWMTKRGKMTPINRNGINRISEISVLRKASFEETVKILYEAAIHSEVDALSGISERIILGKACEVGTNTFDVIVDRSKTGEFFKINRRDKFELDELEQLPRDRAEPATATPFLKNTPNPYLNTPNR